ncbi:UNVERIFIED_CONTAM: hypothetical protein FKN15_025469 [Acipenser sinensis]
MNLLLFLSHPLVQAIPKLDLRSAVSADKAAVLILSCSAVGFYPRDVTLSWDSSPPGLPSSTQQGPPTVNQDGSYSTSTSLQVNETLWSPGTEISCVLNHSSLAQPLREYIRRGGSLFVEYAVRHFLSAVIALLIIGLLFKVYKSRKHDPGLPEWLTQAAVGQTPSQGCGQQLEDHIIIILILIITL